MREALSMKEEEENQLQVLLDGDSLTVADEELSDRLMDAILHKSAHSYSYIEKLMTKFQPIFKEKLTDVKGKLLG